MPSQAIVDASHPERAPSMGRKFFVVLFTIVAIATSVLTSVFGGFGGALELTAITWLTMMLFAIDYGWNRYKQTHEFDCTYCTYNACKDLGKDQKLFFCDRWVAKPKFFGVIVMVVYSGINTMIYIFTPVYIVRLVTTQILTFSWTFTILLGIFNLQHLRKEVPHGYQSPPQHPTTCECRGKGLCPYCHGSGKKTFMLRGEEDDTCNACKGKKVCPTELKQIRYSDPGNELFIIGCITLLVGALSLYLILNVF